MVNKILFYDLLQIKRPNELDPLEIPDSLTKGSVLASTLQGYFNRVLKIDYKTIYTTDFIDSVAFPDIKEVVVEVRDLVRVLQRYDLAQLGYDVVGRIFERLIPEEERHNLGQYFTRSDIVDLILRFCVKHEDNKVLDPACGAGTFLVRAYQHKKMRNATLTHEKLLETLYGNDIAKFPAHLATINLAIKDLGSNENYPRILQEDFFALQVKQDGFDSDNLKKKYAIDLEGGRREIPYPRYFDAIVGNPPYTRQEEISKISEGDEEYKETLIERALLDVTNRPLAKIGKRAGIHAYFFIHGYKFLKQGGRFGFIVSESWLDVDYGKGLQEFFLKNYKIVAIIASKVERWFVEADINTCIIILEKCDKKKERDENLCRFVYLKKSLDHFIPPAQEIWEKERGRLQKIDEIIRTISGHDAFYENDDLRIYPKSQRELWEEGVEIEEDGGQEHTEKEKKEKYVGSKWGKYLRAPDIFFKILEKGKGKFVPLREISHVQRGFTTGANEFFYITEEDIKQRKIEKEFWMHKKDGSNWTPNYVIKGPRECDSLIVKPEDLKYRVLIVHKRRAALKNTEVLRYIEWGERQGFHRRPTCAVRENWYELQEVKTDLIWIKGIWNRHFIPVAEFEPFIDQQLYALQLKEKKWLELLAATLNSTYFAIFQELTGRVNFGEGILWIAVYEPLQLPVISPAVFSEEVKKNVSGAFKKILGRQIGTVFEEIGAELPEEVSLNKVNPDRRELDKIIMGDILGLTEEEQLEVYKAVVDLVRSRIEKAQSVEKGKKYIEGVDVEALAGSTAKRYKEKKK
ncbi:MAG: HsdM family class I SAM-dependent methyltransferase [Candidatus Zixiibacteriota bacterium]